MTDSSISASKITSIEHDWPPILNGWSYALGRPLVSGRVKTQPEDFSVIEQMDVEPCGQGEHVWLRVGKRLQNTDQVARHVARFCNVAYRDVGYSGLKDFFAATEQWFSVWLPGAESPDWNSFEMEGVQVLQHARHSRKIKRGTHKANQFSILIRGLSSPSGDLEHRLELVRRQGVPNYFGAQRFGRGCNNMTQARAMLRGERQVKNRHLRGILLSAARSWLFNTILSARIKAHSWQDLQHREPANLDGSGSVFLAEGDENELNRLLAMDIHPTAPLWGEVNASTIAAYQDLYNYESALLGNYQDIADGLCAARLAYQRRATRMRVNQLQWRLDGDQLKITFSLHKGQFASSVLRELVAVIDRQAAPGTSGI